MAKHPQFPNLYILPDYPYWGLDFVDDFKINLYFIRGVTKVNGKLSYYVCSLEAVGFIYKGEFRSYEKISVSVGVLHQLLQHWEVFRMMAT